MYGVTRYVELNVIFGSNKHLPTIPDIELLRINREYTDHDSGHRLLFKNNPKQQRLDNTLQSP